MCKIQFKDKQNRITTIDLNEISHFVIGDYVAGGSYARFYKDESCVLGIVCDYSKAQITNLIAFSQNNNAVIEVKEVLK